MLRLGRTVISFSTLDAQRAIDEFGAKLRPIVARCRCGRRISESRLACRACALAMLAEEQAARDGLMRVGERLMSTEEWAALKAEAAA